jgi:hypothetical protein
MLDASFPVQPNTYGALTHGFPRFAGSPVVVPSAYAGPENHGRQRESNPTFPGRHRSPPDSGTDSIAAVCARLITLECHPLESPGTHVASGLAIRGQYFGSGYFLRYPVASSSDSHSSGRL